MTWVNIVGAGTAGTHGVITGTTSGSILDSTGGIVIHTVSNTVETGPKNVIQITHKKGVAPGVYFRFVKSKLQELEVERLKERVAPLRGLLEGAHSCGQQGLVEELERQLVTVFRYQEAAAAGFTKIIPERYIKNFREKVRDKTVDFWILSRFPRPIPLRPRQVIERVNDLSLFDELWVLFNNPKQEELKATSQKIREKDPIVFGRFLCDPSNYIYVTDWIDEHCDITLETLVDEVGVDAVVPIDPLTAADVKVMRERVAQRLKALEDTNSRTWREREQLQKDLDMALDEKRRYASLPLFKRLWLAVKGGKA